MIKWFYISIICTYGPLSYWRRGALSLVPHTAIFWQGDLSTALWLCFQTDTSSFPRCLFYTSLWQKYHRLLTLYLLVWGWGLAQQYCWCQFYTYWVYHRRIFYLPCCFSVLSRNHCNLSWGIADEIHPSPSESGTTQHFNSWRKGV